MTTATHEALSEIEKAVTKEDVLKLIPKFEIKPLFVRPHLDRETVAGTIGERGGGKSATDAVVSITDHMFMGKTVYSNMNISCDIEIDDETAMKYGLNSGGVASYQSEPLIKDELLALDDRHRDCCIVIEEINVQYANVRRFMANTNVDFNEVCQQLRKFKASLIYNVIDEMFIDPQLRALTDYFIRTYDTCFDLDALANKKPRGVDFKWRIFPMSGYLAGEQGKYSVTHKSIDGVFFNFGRWHGVFNSEKHQEKGIYSMSTRDKNKRMMAQLSAESSLETIAETDKWGWLAKKAIEWKNKGITELKPVELAQHLGRPATKDVKDQLKVLGIYYDRVIQSYRVEAYALT